MTKPKQTLYKTAYSPLYECFVGIDHAHQDVNDQWIFTCHLVDSPPDAPIGDCVLFREYELERFCL